MPISRSRRSPRLRERRQIKKWEKASARARARARERKEDVTKRGKDTIEEEEREKKGDKTKEEKDTIEERKWNKIEKRANAKRRTWKSQRASETSVTPLYVYTRTRREPASFGNCQEPHVLLPAKEQREWKITVIFCVKEEINPLEDTNVRPRSQSELRDASANFSSDTHAYAR